MNPRVTYKLGEDKPLLTIDVDYALGSILHELIENDRAKRSRKDSTAENKLHKAITALFGAAPMVEVA